MPTGAHEMDTETHTILDFDDCLSEQADDGERPESGPDAFSGIVLGTLFGCAIWVLISLFVFW